MQKQENVAKGDAADAGASADASGALKGPKRGRVQRIAQGASAETVA